MITTNELIQFLANYNSWRRGDETIERPRPAEVGAAIDDAINLLRKHEQIIKQARTLRDKAVKAKKKHRKSDCEYVLGGHTCGACHFYSGAIEALNELLNEHPKPVTPTKPDALETDWDDSDGHCPSRNQGAGD